MAIVIKDRVKVTTTTTGTGTYTLGSAKAGFQDFSTIGDGNTTYYTVTNGIDFEVGIGTYTASGTTLSRDTIFESSNSGNAVNWSAGSKDVFATYSAERAIYVDGTDIVSPNGAVLEVANGGTGSSSLTANNVILGNGTSSVQFVAPGTSGNGLTSNGSTWTSAAAGGDFASGSVLMFGQTTAPTGWTKNTSSHNNHAIRVVTGTAATGGTQDFTTAFASQTPSGSVSVSGSVGQTTLSLSTIPNNTGSVNHTTTNASNWWFSQNNQMFVATSTSGQYRNGGAVQSGATSIGGLNVQTQGLGGSHGHGYSTSGSFSGNAINLAVRYFDVITASKD